MTSCVSQNLMSTACIEEDEEHCICFSQSTQKKKKKKKKNFVCFSQPADSISYTHVHTTTAQAEVIYMDIHMALDPMIAISYREA